MRQGSSCVGCLTVFFASIIILTFMGMLARYGWVILLLAAAAGIYWYRNKSMNNRKGQEQNKTEIRETAEKIVLRVAALNEGLVTPMDVVLASDMTLEQAGEILEGLRQKGYAKLRVAENGSYVYQLDGLLSAKQKRESERL
ncbi:hypothetical protein ACFFNY_13050 [Paenibacillus hodogayensis]|uniref:Uncharacterized protein n=1 Tax=Paenibacillus hodogayensis TaxID=279208 RepID=A0ABV5VW75_9BACL